MNLLELQEKPPSQRNTLDPTATREAFDRKAKLDLHKNFKL